MCCACFASLFTCCVGAPAFCLMFLAAYRATGASVYLQRAIHAADVVWKRGLLLKGPGLCHGIRYEAETQHATHKTPTPTPHNAIYHTSNTTGTAVGIMCSLTPCFVCACSGNAYCFLELYKITKVSCCDVDAAPHHDVCACHVDADVTMSTFLMLCRILCISITHGHSLISRSLHHMSNSYNHNR